MTSEEPGSTGGSSSNARSDCRNDRLSIIDHCGQLVLFKHNGLYVSQSKTLDAELPVLGRAMGFAKSKVKWSVAWICRILWVKRMHDWEWGNMQIGLGLLPFQSLEKEWDRTRD
jgi:hypothetical protein